MPGRFALAAGRLGPGPGPAPARTRSLRGLPAAGRRRRRLESRPDHIRACPDSLKEGASDELNWYNHSRIRGQVNCESGLSLEAPGAFGGAVGFAPETTSGITRWSIRLRDPHVPNRRLVRLSRRRRPSDRRRRHRRVATRDARGGCRAARRRDRCQPDECAASLAGRPRRDGLPRLPRHHAAAPASNHSGGHDVRRRRPRDGHHLLLARRRRDAPREGRRTDADLHDRRHRSLPPRRRLHRDGRDRLGEGLPPSCHVALDRRQRGEERAQLEELPRRRPVARRAHAPGRLHPDPVRPQRPARQRA